MSERTMLLEERTPGRLSVQGARLVVQKGPDKGRELRLAHEEVVVGSAESADLRLTDATVSRNHLSVSVRPEGFLLTDLDSTNGTRVEGRRACAVYLEAGDRIELGTTRLRFEIMPDATVLDLSVAPSFGKMVGRSVAARRMFALLEAVAAQDVSVLLLGETGTGKDLAAESIHDASPRANGPFVVVDCGSLTKGLVESSLFGHEEGAFTGAIAQHRGAFEEAHGGTLYLDEVGELPLDLQPRLLRVLERKQIRRVGGESVIPIDVRIIAATKRDLKLDVNRRTFREDLYYRLNVITIRVPPLRDRREDIPMLAELFRRQLGGGSNDALDDALIELLVADQWPGNLRELRNRVERSLALPMPDDDDAPNRSYRDAKQAVIDAFEKTFLRNLLAKTRGNRSEAARLASMDRVNLIKLLRKHAL
jgi:DNA-binding NtrC family response regulator